MGKRGKSLEDRYSAGRANTEDRLSVFDFNRHDSRVETESLEILAKYGGKRPRKKAGRDNHQPIDKYVFLETFARGRMTRQNESENDVMDVDIPDIVSNEKLNLDSRENSIMALRLSTSRIDLSDNAGSLEGRTSYYDATQNDCEPVVVVSTKYAKYANAYYTGCILIFSQTCVRLEGSTAIDRNKPSFIEWLTSDILEIEYHQDENVDASFVCIHLKLEDERGSEVKNDNPGLVELEFLIDDPKWFEKQEEIKSLDSKYKASWRTIISEWSFNEPCGDILYPSGDPDAVVITSKDIQLLRPKTFINDTIVDFYIKYLVNKFEPEEQLKFHFFNTFFFQKLVDVFRDCSQTIEGEESFQSFHKWTKNVDIFSKDYVFIPVNFSLHWSLIVICYPGQIPTHVAGLGLNDSFKIPCILHMDSLRGSHRGLENYIRRYLWEEWKQHNLGKDTFTKFSNLDFIALKLPQQENFFDCGLFLLHYAELFMEQNSKFSMSKYEDTLNEVWFHPAEVTLKKRYQIRKLIRKIVDDSSPIHSPVTTNDAGFCSGESKVAGFGQKEVGSNDSCIAIEHISDDDHHIAVQQSCPGIARRVYKSLVDNYYYQNNTEVVDLFSSERVPIEDEDVSQLKFLSGDRINKTSEDSCSNAPVANDLPNEECHIPEDAYETIEERCKTLLSEENLETCVVEDSEEESETEFTSRSLIPVPPFIDIS